MEPTAVIALLSSAVPLFQILGPIGTIVVICLIAYMGVKGFSQSMKALHEKMNSNHEALKVDIETLGRRIDRVDVKVDNIHKEFSETYVRKDNYERDLALQNLKIKETETKNMLVMLNRKIIKDEMEIQQ